MRVVSKGFSMKGAILVKRHTYSRIRAPAGGFSYEFKILQHLTLLSWCAFFLILPVILK